MANPLSGISKDPVQALMRLGGVALLVGGILVALMFPLHPSGSEAGAVQRDIWLPLHQFMMLGYFLIAFGLAGLYLRMGSKAGATGLAGYVLTFLGVLLITGLMTIETYVAPVLVPASMSVMEAIAGGPLSFVGPMFPVATVLTNVGLILLAVSLSRSGVVPRLVAQLLLAGAVLSMALFMGTWAELVATVGFVACGVALAWVGLVMVREERAEPAAA